MIVAFVIAVLILLNAYFSAAEIALVSVEKYKVQEEADQGNKKAMQVLSYLQNPNEYLSTIQFGLTLIGLFEGLYGGEVFQQFLEPKFKNVGLSTNIAHLLSILMGIGFISYVTIVIGELLPKSLALKQPQKLAFKIIPSFGIFSLIAYPFVQILTASTRVILKFFRVSSIENNDLTDNDLKNLLGLAYRQGTLEKEELKLHENIFSFYEQNVELIMTPLKDIVSIQIDLAIVEADTIIRNSNHSYFPVVDSKNYLVGFISAKDYFRDTGRTLKDQTRPACVINKNQKASELLKQFKAHKQNFGIVTSEAGLVYGLVTMHDIGELLIGEIP